MGLHKHPATDRECLRGHSCEGHTGCNETFGGSRLSTIGSTSYRRSSQEVVSSWFNSLHLSHYRLVPLTNSAASIQAVERSSDALVKLTSARA
jgi:hypothetical protein